MTKTDIIKSLGLTPHMEGGYFVRTYKSDRHIETNESSRSVMTSIYYLLTDDSPVGALHKNKSDIMHYYHGGGAIRYVLLYPDGRLEEKTLGNDLLQGQQLQLLVKGGCWKASQLLEGEYGLISEAVTPGFDFDDHELAQHDQIKRRFPEQYDQVALYIK